VLVTAVCAALTVTAFLAAVSARLASRDSVARLLSAEPR